MRLDPAQLPPGYVSEAKNCRFRKGEAETRLGFVMLPWINKIPKAIGTVTRSGGTATFTATYPHGFITGDSAIISGFDDSAYNGTKTVTVTSTTVFTYSVSGTPVTPDPNTGYAVVNKIQPWGTVRGAGRFRDPNTRADYHIIAAGDYVYYTTENNSAWQLALPSGVTITDTVTFTQCYDTLIMFRGTSLPPLAMPNVDTGFQNIVQTLANVESGTNVIPAAARGVFFQNRLFIPNGTDGIALSDFGDYTRYQPVTQELTVNQGSNDSLVTLAKFNDATMIAFKQNSIYAISNIYGNLAAALQDQITDQFGLAAADSVAHCGADLLFLSQMGVMSLRQTEQNKIQSVTVPFSEPVQPLIDRINWRYASGAYAVYNDSKYYLAVPLDSAEVIGPELVGGDYTAEQEGLDPNTGIVVRNLEVGATYRFELGNATNLVMSGLTTLTTSAEFVATATTAEIAGPTGDARYDTATASLKRVEKGVNNAILVFDFLARSWSGYDDYSDLAIKRLDVYTYMGRDRVFMTTSGGWVVLYEEDFEDHLIAPYVDVTVSTLPSNGNTIQVNGGTTVTVSSAGTQNSNTWGCLTLANAQSQIWNGSTGTGGYGGNTDNWTSPDAIPVRITNGVRFYSTNGRVPTVTITGSWHDLTEATTRSIDTTIVTRAYTPDGGLDLSTFDWLSYDIETWNPNYALTALMDGAFEERVLDSSITKSRTTYTVFGRAAYDATNTNLDSDNAHREDYSVLIGDYTDVAGYVLDDDEVDITRHQQFREEFKVRGRGRSARIKFASTQGRLRLKSCKLENRRMQTRAGGKT